MNDLYRRMLDAYDRSTTAAEHNAICEVYQQIVLSALSQSGFFNIAAFYGGTCLRIFHGLQRFSEDMDFTLLAPAPHFDLSDYFRPIVDEFAYIGRKVELRKKVKTNPGRVETAFLRDNTDAGDLTFQTTRTIKIKIEVDTCPPLDFHTEYKLLMMPHSFMTRCLTLPDLFAGKMHALVFRNWKSRVKGRDWYDFEWYVRNRIPLHFKHLQARIREFNGIDVTPEQFLDRLRKRLATTDIRLVKQDVLPFVQHPDELQIWSNDYFLQLVELMQVEESEK